MHVPKSARRLKRQLPNCQGITNNYSVIHFNVSPGQQRLVGSLAWPGNPTYCLQDGCNAGLSGVDVATRSRAGGPASSLVTSPPTAGPTGRPVADRHRARRGLRLGVPSLAVLAPGQRKTFTVKAATPSAAGDSNGSIVGGTVTAGVWDAGTATISMSATVKAFDVAVTSPTGDLRQVSVNPAAAFSPVTINPGRGPSALRPGLRRRAVRASLRVHGRQLA